MRQMFMALGFLSVAGLAATVFLGLRTGAEGGVLEHMGIGVPATLLALFTHSMAMMYFVGTGKSVREAVAEHGLDPELEAESRRFKRELFPIQTWAIGLLMLAAILGGGAHSRTLAPAFHTIPAYVAVAVNLLAFYRLRVLLDANQVLIGEVDRQALEAARS